MNLDLKEVPFSMRGSYMAVSYCGKNFRGSGLEEGLYLRTVHGNAKTPYVARIVPLHKGKICTYRIEAQPEKVELLLEDGTITLAFADSDTLLLGGKGEGLGIDWISCRGMPLTLSSRFFPVRIPGIWLTALKTI